MKAQDVVTAEAPSPVVLDARNLSRRYRKRQALDDVSLQLHAGELTVLLGPNGAGKTTLLAILCGLLRPDSGTVTVFDHSLRAEPAMIHARTGNVFQQPSLDLELSAQQNLRFHARLHGMPRGWREARIRKLLGMMDLSEQANLPARMLSGGNRRRLELARALLHEPALLLMDEPTVGLDPHARRDLLQQICRLRDERRMAILWATHLTDEAESADHVIVLQDGRVLASMSPARLRAESGCASLGDAFEAVTRGTAREKMT